MGVKLPQSKMVTFREKEFIVRAASRDGGDFRGLLKQSILKTHWYDETGKQIDSIATLKTQNYNLDCQI